jgi:hypothetical protein
MTIKNTAPVQAGEPCRLSGELRQARLHELLHYNPETGLFTRKGRIAGSRDNRGYWRVGVAGSVSAAHRLAWFYVYGEWPSGPLDHINGDRLDNRIANLRIATPAQNAANVARWRGNTSGYRGVVYHRQCGKWQAQIGGRQRRYLGLFDDQREAHEVYHAEMVALFGEFVRAPS